MFEVLAGAPDAEHHDLSDGAFSDLRSLLADVARTRVRQGFSPTETAVGVFAVKEAVLEMLESQGELEGYRFFASSHGSSTTSGCTCWTPTRRRASR